MERTLVDVVIILQYSMKIECTCMEVMKLTKEY